MKHLIGILALTLVMGTPCAARESVGGRSGSRASAPSTTQRERYEKEIKSQLHKLDRKIEALKAQAPQKTAEARKQFDQDMTQLNRKREIAKRKFDQLERNSQKAWQKAKPDMDAAMKDLKKAYDKAAAQFK